ncbi:tyrosine-protein phosphatase non-receptor type 5 isoform X2 [Gouania willdenowi]|uniref:tyrosine-protein phosphatase non-receptor type 5 isoform X2 n=1 Tax=Gouania willdenowi TaxID=441366 RepID=UPI001055C86F|nr:receptor-type tyrosine-protein phosphatase R isoform X2 [Gouania willdenowi]
MGLRGGGGGGRTVLGGAVSAALVSVSSNDPVPSHLLRRFPPSFYLHTNANDLLEPLPLHHLYHRHHSAWITTNPPESRPRSLITSRRVLNTPSRSHHDVRLEHAAVSPSHLVTMYLAVDVRGLSAGLLRGFRDGVAAALGVSPSHVHINQLNKKNGVELFVSSDRLGASEPRPAEEVIQSLNVRVLHRHLGHFGITEVSTEKNVLQGEPKYHGASSEGLYGLVLFITIVSIIITCILVLYRLSVKAHSCECPLKVPPPGIQGTTPFLPDSTQKWRNAEVVSSGSMVQGLDTPTPKQQPTIACRRLPPPVIPPSPAPTAVISSINPVTHTSVALDAANNELKPCPSPFRMKPAAGLQERRGSNVSLVLDMSALGSVEPLSVAVVTPREAVAREYLLSASRMLNPQQLCDVVKHTHRLHAEFTEIPMNFIDPKELDVPNHGTKNRYKTILPNPHSRVILKSRTHNDLLSSYINANYIRGYAGDNKAFIATQGPLVNTVNDFWWMAWQEEAPVIVMITKLKEKNEKCVLYWPEKRGIYGKVEVLVNSVGEFEHYTTRRLTLKCGNQTRELLHYWYTSWPDHKTPDSALPLLQLMAEVENGRRAAAAPGPVIIHCSAGIGRTGCFIATTIGCKQLQAKGLVDVLSITCQLRADRGGMIQTAEQYEFVHHALTHYVARLSEEAGQ